MIVRVTKLYLYVAMNPKTFCPIREGRVWQVLRLLNDRFNYIGDNAWYSVIERVTVRISGGTPAVLTGKLGFDSRQWKRQFFGSGAHAVSCSMSTAPFSQGVKPPRRETGYSHPSDVKIKIVWNYSSITLSSPSNPSLIKWTTYFIACICTYTCRCSTSYKPWNLPTVQCYNP
jgi:hypothetical protein